MADQVSRWLPASPGWVWVQVACPTTGEETGIYPVAYFELFADEAHAAQYARPVICRDRSILEVVPTKWLEVAAAGGVVFDDGRWVGAGLIGPTEDAGRAFNDLQSKVRGNWAADPKGLQS